MGKSVITSHLLAKLSEEKKDAQTGSAPPAPPSGISFLYHFYFYSNQMADSPQQPADATGAATAIAKSPSAKNIPSPLDKDASPAEEATTAETDTAALLAQEVYVFFFYYVY